MLLLSFKTAIQGNCLPLLLVEIYQGVFKWKSLGFTMLNQSQSNQHNKIFIIVLETPNSKILKTKVNRAAHTHWIQYSTPRYRDIKRAVLGWAYLLRGREREIYYHRIKINRAHWLSIGYPCRVVIREASLSTT